MKVGQEQRISEVGDSISKLDPGGYLIGCGPYTQGYIGFPRRKLFSEDKPHYTKSLLARFWISR